MLNSETARFAMCQMIRLSGDEINHLSAALTGTRPEMWHPQREIFPVRLWKVRPEAWVGGLPPCLYRRFTGSSAECSRHTTGAVSSPSRLCGGVISFHSLRYCPVNKGVQAFALSLCVGLYDIFLSFGYLRFDTVIGLFYIICSSPLLCLRYSHCASSLLDGIVWGGSRTKPPSPPYLYYTAKV